ncbi:MAG: hypothetical protein AAF564_12925 [Bacteroidota bacterium]
MPPRLNPGAGLKTAGPCPEARARYLDTEIGGHVMYLPGAAGDINQFADKTPVDQGGFEEVGRMGRVLADEVIRGLPEMKSLGE